MYVSLVVGRYAFERNVSNLWLSVGEHTGLFQRNAVSNKLNTFVRDCSAPLPVRKLTISPLPHLIDEADSGKNYLFWSTLCRIASQKIAVLSIFASDGSLFTAFTTIDRFPDILGSVQCYPRDKKSYANVVFFVLWIFCTICAIENRRQAQQDITILHSSSPWDIPNCTTYKFTNQCRSKRQWNVTSNFPFANIFPFFWLSLVRGQANRKAHPNCLFPSEPLFWSISVTHFFEQTLPHQMRTATLTVLFQSVVFTHKTSFGLNIMTPFLKNRFFFTDARGNIFTPHLTRGTAEGRFFCCTFLKHIFFWNATLIFKTSSTIWDFWASHKGTGYLGDF